MLKGIVSRDLEPIVEIQLIFPDKMLRQFAVIDTGFNGALSVPSELIASSGWEFVGYEKYEIADGAIIKAEVYLGEVLFDGRKRRVGILSSDSKDILIGTRLIQDKVLTVNFKTGYVEVR